MLPEAIFQQTMKWEKGFVNDPDDKGGMTNDGITWGHYQAFCREVLNRPPSFKHFKNLSLSDKRAFFNRIWLRMQCDKIKDITVAAVCFDFGVNSGFAKREIQELLQGWGHKFKADNIFGPITIGALNKAVEKMGTEAVVTAILDKRQDYVLSLDDRDPSQTKFIKGWTNRIDDWRAFAFQSIKTSPSVVKPKPTTETVQTPSVES